MKLENGNEKIPFYASTCVKIFLDQMDYIHESIQNGEARHELIQNFRKTLGMEIPYEIKSQIQYPDQIEKLYEQLNKEYKIKFFMIDLFPENEERFSFIDNIIAMKN